MFGYKKKQGVGSVPDNNVVVYAPSWVEKALNKLFPTFKDHQFPLEGTDQTVTIKDKISLIDLLITRNERYSRYSEESRSGEISLSAMMALKDLGKHCVTVGEDTVVSTSEQPVYVCELSPLQFQGFYNSGRHVLIAKDDDIFHLGALDKEIYQNTVGEPKPVYINARKDKSGRFVKAKFGNDEVLFDTFAYHRFVAQDFTLAALSLNRQAKAKEGKAKDEKAKDEKAKDEKAKDENDDINFKFLKYGMGVFAEGLSIYDPTKSAYLSANSGDKVFLSKHLAKGVLLGLKDLLAMPKAIFSQIKRIELPYYATDVDDELKQILQEIRALCFQNNIDFSDHAVPASVKSPNYKTATTSSSKPQAPTGNYVESEPPNDEAFIAGKLKDKGNKFNPIYNREMQGKYIIFPFRTLGPEVVWVKNPQMASFAWYFALEELMIQIPGVEKTAYRIVGQFGDKRPDKGVFHKGELIFTFRSNNTRQVDGAVVMEFVNKLAASGFEVDYSPDYKIKLEGKALIEFGRFLGFPEEALKEYYERFGINYEHMLNSGLFQPLKQPIPLGESGQSAKSSTLLPGERSQTAKPSTPKPGKRSQAGKQSTGPEIKELTVDEFTQAIGRFAKENNEEAEKLRQRKVKRISLFSGLVGIASGITSGALAYATLKGSSTLLIGLPYVKSAIELYLELKGTSAFLFATGVPFSVGVFAFVVTAAVVFITTAWVVEYIERKNSKPKDPKEKVIGIVKIDPTVPFKVPKNASTYTPRHSERSISSVSSKSSTGDTLQSAASAEEERMKFR
ncbi:MAG: hypothetical protein ACHQJ6_08785 [Candidatus Berkiellales bacterium]